MNEYLHPIFLWRCHILIFALLSLLVCLMMTSSNGNIFRVTGPLCGEFTSQRQVTRSFDVFLDLRLNKPLSKQLWGLWFETLSRPLWRHSDAELLLVNEAPEGIANDKLTQMAIRYLNIMSKILSYQMRFKSTWGKLATSFTFNTYSYFHDSYGCAGINLQLIFPWVSWKIL